MAQGACTQPLSKLPPSQQEALLGVRVRRGWLWGEERTHATIQIRWLSILCLSSFSAKESITSAKTSSSKRIETKQEEKSHQFPQKGSEPFEKQVA